MPADEAQLRHPVATLRIPVVHELGALLDHLLLFVLRGRVDEEAVLREGDLLARLLEDVAHVRILRAPEHALAADDGLRPGLEELVELVDVEGLPALVDEGRDVVLEDLGVLMLLGVIHCIDPGSGIVGAAEVEAAGIEQLLHRHVAVVGDDDLCIALEAPDESLELGELVLRHEVALVQDDGGAELELLDQQRLDIVFLDIVAQQVLAAIEAMR